jgi:hypothetical protein
MPIARIVTLIAALTIVGACKPRDYTNTSEEKSGKLLPADEQNGGAAHKISMLQLLTGMIMEKRGQIPERLTMLPADFRSWFFDQDGAARYDFEIMREGVTKWNKPHECWYLIKRSKADGKQMGDATPLTKGFVAVEEAFEKSREFWSTDEKNSTALLMPSVYAEEEKFLKTKLYDCFSSSAKKCNIQGSTFTVFFLNYYLPAAKEKSNESWSNCSRTN